MKILFLNWRDKKNPIAGGAEVLTHEVARRWAAQGHEVTLLTSRFPGSAGRETVDGVSIIRVGNPWTVYWHAYQTYRREFRGQCDVVIDEVNTVPFFTPWYVQEPVLMHFNQLAREVWLYECPWPVSWIGLLLEPLWLRIYRRSQAVAISRSSRHDLLKLGFDQHRVAVIPMPTHPDPSGSTAPREENPTLLFVGRLKRSKRVDHAIEALSILRKRWPAMKLWIVGSGDAAYKNQLERQVRHLDLTGRVHFYGQVSEEKKQQLMQSAHVILVPSVREGWGLIVSEAYSKRTPAVVYPVAGLVDSAEHRMTGLVARRATPHAMAQEVVELLENKSLWKRLTQPAAAQTAVSWNETAAAYLETIRRAAGQPAAPAPPPSLT
ncbi:MAG: glycosyltransferase family 4 protein, partial [Candidatus Omnitrophica bacterium]|nr:glycosyltransferase family 4 protein [Candidatus Omnitrophota bacterium]